MMSEPDAIQALRDVLFSIFASFLLFQGETCCELAAGGWGCCRFQNATCCNDQVCSLTTNLVRIFRGFFVTVSNSGVNILAQNDKLFPDGILPKP